MSTISMRSIHIVSTGDVCASNSLMALPNPNAPGDIDVVRLAIGDNVITVPTGGTTPKAVSIVKPPGNTTTIKLKGVIGDVGVVLHPTDPDSISLDTSQASFVLNATAQVDVRLHWS